MLAVFPGVLGGCGEEEEEEGGGFEISPETFVSVKEISSSFLFSSEFPCTS